jgi:hypothetical protein
VRSFGEKKEATGWRRDTECDLQVFLGVDLVNWGVPLWRMGPALWWARNGELVLSQLIRGHPMVGFFFFLFFFWEYPMVGLCGPVSSGFESNLCEDILLKKTYVRIKESYQIFKK